jgi:uncharacterized protein with ParB-like and HNH nuclease domain
MVHDPIDIADFDIVRGQVTRDYGTVDTEQSTFNVAIQEIEDWYNSQRTALFSRINAATVPFVFSDAQKDLLIKYWFTNRSSRETG